jgi:hypothetical protein
MCIFGFNLSKTGTLTSRLAYLIQTTSDNASLQLSLLSNILDIPSGYSSDVPLCEGTGFT